MIRGATKVLPGFLRSAALVLSPKNVPAKVSNVALWLRLQRNAEALAVWNEFFTAEEYLSLNPDVASSGVDPCAHFLLSSNRELRNPSPRFDTRYYLGRYRAVAQSGLNPLLHYALYGKSEGRTVIGRSVVKDCEPIPQVNPIVTPPEIPPAALVSAGSPTDLPT